jgi:hypothetical protein
VNLGSQHVRDLSWLTRTPHERRGVFPACPMESTTAAGRLRCDVMVSRTSRVSSRFPHGRDALRTTFGLPPG